mgnify:CR=1 FL=1
MNELRKGRQSIVFPNYPSIAASAAVAGKKEGKGPLRADFDQIAADTKLGQASWEKAESKMVQISVGQALSKGNFEADQIDMAFAGDLLNKCIGSVYGLRDLGIPFVGLYGACSTMAESLALAALFVDTSIAKKALAVTSSHFCSAERQFRFPLEYGGQRPPTAQWTVTGSGACVVGESDAAPFVRAVTLGCIEDLGIKDANNMGAAMAWAAYDTISQHFQDTNRSSSFYDLIVTGDLGKLGMEIVIDLFAADGIELRGNYSDCGVMLFDLEGQDVHCGASGCGCAASVLTGYLLNGMRAGKWRNLLFCATGALHSPTSLGQGESIPGICHAVAISTKKG